MMIDHFANQRRPVVVKGKGNEAVVFASSGKSINRFTFNYVFKGLLQDNTSIVDGDMLIDGGDAYFVVAVRTLFRSTEALLYKANAVVDAVRLMKHYNSQRVQDGLQEVPVELGAVTLHETINAGMRQMEPGLLPTTTKRFLLSNCGLQLLDRIKLAGASYQVDAIDDSNYAGLLSVQCSLDKRVTT